EVTGGLVREVPDGDILDAKASIGAGGLGCEPASAASVAGLKLLVEQGIISPDDRVACVLTGHVLKDPNVSVDYHSLKLGEFRKKYADKFEVTRLSFPNHPIQVPNDLEAILKTLEDRL
ncbi:MAG: threonine synthase, partial [Planctomycetes bacterium DG_58]